MTATIEIIVSILILIGGFFSLVGTIGIIRLPDVYGKLHAATKSATLGVICIMLGSFLFMWLIEGEFSGKILLTILFVFLTAPVGAHMISQSAYRTGVSPMLKSDQDDLKEAMKMKEKE